MDKGAAVSAEGAAGEAKLLPPTAPPAPPPALTAEQSARVAEEVRAAASARSRAVGRALRGVRVTFLSGGDWAEDFAAKGKLDGLFHVVALSGRSVHHLGSPAALLRTLSPEGAVLVAETARNVPTLTPEQRAEYARRVMAMAARAGGVLLGGDRALSADTFAVGTVLDLAPPQQQQQPSAGAVLHLHTPPSGAVSGLPAPLASTTFAGAPALGGGAAGDGAGQRRPLNVKALGMEPFSFADGPLPPADALARAAGKGATALAAAADAAAAHAAAHIRGVASHDVCGGDNPFPEALVFAVLPHPAAPALADAFARLEGGGSSGE